MISKQKISPRTSLLDGMSHVTLYVNILWYSCWTCFVVPIFLFLFFTGWLRLVGFLKLQVSSTKSITMYHLVISGQSHQVISQKKIPLYFFFIFYGVASISRLLKITDPFHEEYHNVPPSDVRTVPPSNITKKNTTKWYDKKKTPRSGLKQKIPRNDVTEIFHLVISQ